jgi:hypothetical protein
MAIAVLKHKIILIETDWNKSSEDLGISLRISQWVILDIAVDQPYIIILWFISVCQYQVLQPHNRMIDY